MQICVPSISFFNSVCNGTYLRDGRVVFDSGLSSKAIARELDARGIRTQGGSAWYSSIVFNTLRRAGVAPPQRAGQQRSEGAEGAQARANHVL